MFERFTDEAREVVVRAQHRARDLDAGAVLAEHLLLGALDGPARSVLVEAGVDPDRLTDHVRVAGTTAGDGAALRSLGIDLEQVRQRAEAAFGAGALDRPAPRRRGLLRRSVRLGGALPFDASAKRALEQALREAVARHDDRIVAGHLLLGLLAHDTDRAALAVRAVGVEPEAVRNAARAALSRAA